MCVRSALQTSDRQRTVGTAWKSPNRAAFISESTHSTGLLSSGLAFGNKDTVSRHVHRKLNPQADVPAQELPAAWRAVPPTRSRLSHRLRQQPDYATSLSSLRTKNKLSHQRQTCSLVPHTCSQTSKWAEAS